jgi:hypothetical protein
LLPTLTAGYGEPPGHVGGMMTALDYAQLIIMKIIA